MKRPELNLGNSTDEELVHFAKMGKQDAFAMLYERFLPAVYARVRFKIPETDVEDVTQEVFIAVLKSLHGFRGQSKFGTWIRTITNRKIVDYHRAKSVVTTDSDDYEKVKIGKQSEHDEFLERQDNISFIQTALSELPQNYQDILLMRFVDEMPFSEIARQNGQSIEATKSLFRRSIAALSEKMQDENE
jgi:RNA polymerase sigma-70 factor, ECF subfamily